MFAATPKDPKENLKTLLDKQHTLMESPPDDITSSELLRLMLQYRYQIIEQVDALPDSSKNLNATFAEETPNAAMYNHLLTTSIYPHIFEVLSTYKSLTLFQKLMADESYTTMSDDHPRASGTMSDYQMEMLDSLLDYDAFSIEKLHPEVLLSIVKNHSKFEPLLLNLIEKDFLPAERIAELEKIHYFANLLSPFFGRPLLDGVSYPEMAELHMLHVKNDYAKAPYLLYRLCQDPDCMLATADKDAIQDKMYALFDNPTPLHGEASMRVYKSWCDIESIKGAELEPLELKVDIIRDCLASIYPHRAALSDLLMQPNSVTTTQMNDSFRYLVNLQCQQLGGAFQSYDGYQDPIIIKSILKDSTSLRAYCKRLLPEKPATPKPSGRPKTPPGLG